MSKSLHTQEYLRQGKDIRELGISTKAHGEYPNLVIYTYHQIDSPRHHPVVKECRGLILDTADDYKVVCYPYSRFFNHGEGAAATINWDKALAYEKLDGTLCTLYYYDRAWHIATKGNPQGSGSVGSNTNVTFNQLFWDTFNQLGYELPQESDSNKCFIFELCTELNRVVVQYPDSRLVLHGVRNIESLEELSPNSTLYSWEKVKYIPVESALEVQRLADLSSGVVSEGYVVVDDSFNRVKFKNSKYVALHLLKGELTQTRLVELIQAGEGEEFLTYFPEFNDWYIQLKTTYNKLIHRIEEVYYQHSSIENQKEFAASIKDYEFKSILFSLRKENKDIETAISYLLRTSSTNYILKLMETV